ncbi:MAG: YkoF family thiamine/hydroxymethylpyrimidine-binding protein [Bacteroidota bacterium]
MGISVEISLYPLIPAYKSTILDFLDRLCAYPELTVLTNNMSTRVFGQYDEVFPILQKEIKACFEQPETVVVVMKVIGKNLEE